jgi:uncharacterized membrane protein
MMTNLHLIPVGILALSSAMLSGLFFVFSNFAMNAFSRIRPESGIAAMQSINAAILNPGFFGLFLGSLAAAGMAAFHWNHPASPWVMTGALLYLLGCFAVTAMFNVPLNHQLDTVSAGDPGAAVSWANYVSGWRPWNHVRTIATLLAATAYLVALANSTGN